MKGYLFFLSFFSFNCNDVRAKLYLCARALPLFILNRVFSFSQTKFQPVIFKTNFSRCKYICLKVGLLHEMYDTSLLPTYFF